MTAKLDEKLLREMFEHAVRQSGAFGAQLSIIRGDEKLDFASGTAHAERGRTMTTDTLMQIGSITKVFNATIVHSLVEEGVLHLDTPVKTYLPTFKVADPVATETLTLRHLTSMMSGLDNGRYHYFGSGEEALGRYVAGLHSLPQQFPPGKYFGYANAGICIAGHVAATMSGKPWETLLRERILEPAGLSLSAILDSDLPGKRLSYGHYAQPAGGPRIVEPPFSAMRARAPSGASLALATGDLARFGNIFAKRGVADTGRRILSETSVERMTTPQIKTANRTLGSAWCMGPHTDVWEGVRVFGHGGGTITSSSLLHWIPEKDGVIVFIVNTTAAFAEFARIAFDDILKVAFGFVRPPIDVPEQPLKPIDPPRYVGVYQDLGTTLSVTAGDGGTLLARYAPHRTADELTTLRAQGAVATDERTAIFAPLGSDRFLIKPQEGPDRGPASDTGFFGEDAEGRATNVLNGVFALRRVG